MYSAIKNRCVVSWILAAAACLYGKRSKCADVPERLQTTDNFRNQDQEMIAMKEKYMETLLAQIREKRARESIRREVEGHISDQKAAYLAQGMSGDQAEKQAILDMGDPVETGAELDQLHRPKPAWGMLALAAVLCAAGLLLLYLAQTHSQSGHNGDFYFQNQCKYVVLGFIILCVVYLTDYTRIAAYSQPACIGILLVLCAAANGILPTYRASELYFSGNIWIGGMLSMDLLLYLYLPLYGALLYSFRGCKARQLFRILLFTVLPVFLAFQIAPLSVSINIAAILFLLFFTAVGKGWLYPSSINAIGTGRFKSVFGKGRTYTKYICALGAALSAFFALMLLAAVNSGYQRTRIQAWLHPEEFAGGSGFVGGMIRNIVSTSRLIGRNTGQAADVYLPDYITDYILTYTIGTFGVLAAAALVILVIVFGARLLYISIHQKNQLGMMMGLACSLTFMIQSAEYILVNLSLLPPAGVYFPLVSFGGSGMVQTCILLGILLSIYRYENVVSEAETYASHAVQ